MFTLEELKARLLVEGKAMYEGAADDSDIEIIAAYGECHRVLLGYCVMNGIRVGDHDLGAFNEKCMKDNLSLYDYYRRISSLFDKIEAEFKAGLLADSPEFGELMALYAERFLSGGRMGKSKGKAKGKKNGR